MKDTVIGLFNNLNDVDAALSELGSEGYSEADVSVITKEDQTKLEHPAGEDVKSGVKTGGLVGGVLGLLVGLGALTIPGVGALLVAGPLAAAFGVAGATAATVSGAAVGAVAGGLVGILKGVGIDEVQARSIEEQIKQGNILLLVIPGEDDVDNVKSIMEENNGHHISEMKLNI